jgi:group I intron endonuclease
MNAGIYRIVVERGDMARKFYIGQASNLERRKYSHFGALRRGDHFNTLLQKAFLKYGEGAFSFEILIVCEKRKDILSLYEQAVVNIYDDSLLYNVNLQCVDSPLGRSQSADHRAKISSAHKGKTHSKEHLAAHSARLIGRPLSPEHRAKIGAAHKGRVFSPETRAKIGAANAEIRKGSKLSLETRVKIGNALRGRKCGSPSASSRQKMSAAKIGRKASPETCAKMSASIKEAWKKRRMMKESH